MASLNLSANGPSISKSYQTVVNGQPPAGSAASPTYAQWAVFSVSTPLVNTFQPDAGNKESVLKVQTTGDGELADLIEEFSEGRTQFAYVKVTDPNTGLPKNVLIAWCGEGVPERTKGYFTSHLAAVSKFLHGYHVQITARADGDLSPEGIVQRVSDSSGSKYSGAEPSAPGPGPRPPVSSKPVFTPTRTGGLAPPPVSAAPQHSTARRGVDDDGWGPDAPPVTRTQLEKVQSAYKPTKVNLQELKSENTSPAYRQQPAAAAEEHGNVVRGGYQPVGKVDIAAIRKQAVQSGDMKDDRPAPVKGAYEPVGKVDIAAIRARAQKPEDAGVASGAPSAGMRDQPPTTITLPERPAVSDPAERLTSLPKPKVANKFGGGPAFAGTKPPLPSATGPKPSNVQIGSASRTFADEGGKTPAQLWAERKAREREAPSPTVAEPASIPSQTSGSGAGWKSSYTGKTWAPVQIESATPVGQADVVANEPSEAEASAPSVRDIQSQFAHGEVEQPEPSRAIPIPGLPTGPIEPEVGHVAQQPVPSPPPQPRSPTPPTPPVREGSPIRVAMPVGRGDVADAHEEQHSPPPAMPIESLQEAIPDERDLEESPHDLGRAAAENIAADVQPEGGIQAKVQYDYEKSEDNEIDLREGEYVTDIEMVDKDWWLGVNERGERGLFPGNYVEVEDHVDPAGQEAAPEPEPEPEVAAAAAPAVGSQGPTATALYDYEAAEDNEISFPEGAKIENVEFPDDDWWLGVYHGAQGLFPANYVQLDQ